MTLFRLEHFWHFFLDFFPPQYLMWQLLFAHTCLSLKFLISAVKAISFCCTILSLISNEGRNCSCIAWNYIIPNFGEKDESNLDLQALKILQTGHLQLYCWLVIHKSVFTAGVVLPFLVFFRDAGFEAHPGKGKTVVHTEGTVWPWWGSGWEWRASLPGGTEQGRGHWISSYLSPSEASPSAPLAFRPRMRGCRASLSSGRRASGTNYLCVGKGSLEKHVISGLGGLTYKPWTSRNLLANPL